MTKKYLAFILVFLLLFSLIPVTSFAQETGAEPAEEPIEVTEPEEEAEPAEESPEPEAEPAEELPEEEAQPEDDITEPVAQPEITETEEPLEEEEEVLALEDETEDSEEEQEVSLLENKLVSMSIDDGDAVLVCLYILELGQLFAEAGNLLYETTKRTCIQSTYIFVPTQEKGGSIE